MNNSGASYDALFTQILAGIAVQLSPHVAEMPARMLVPFVEAAHARATAILAAARAFGEMQRTG